MKATKKIVMKKRTRIQGLQTISGNSYDKYNNSSQSLKKDDNKFKKIHTHPEKQFLPKRVSQTIAFVGFPVNGGNSSRIHYCRHIFKLKNHT